MKTTWFLIIVVMAFQLALPNLQAQEQLLFRVEIPFNFVAGGVHLSAGKYLAFHANPATIQLIREDGKASAWIPVKPSPRSNGPEVNQLVFNRYGEAYFLAEVSTGHDQQVHECFRCNAEKTLVAQHQRPQVVAVNTQPPR
jgi:hypothetical protein